MAIAHDTSTNAAAYTLTGTQTTSHVANASARAAVVLIEQDGSTADQVSSVTYAGQTMTRLGSDPDNTEAGRVYIYWLDNIAGGTQNVAMTTSGTAAKYLTVATMTVAANTKVSVAGAGYQTATSASAANPALTLTGLTAGVPVVAYQVIHSGLQTMTTTPQTTPAWTYITPVVAGGDLGTTGYGMARIANTPSGTTLTAGWIAATADDYVISGVAFFEDTLQTLNSAGAIADSGGIGTPALSTGPVTLASAGAIADTGGMGTPVANVIQNLNAAGGIATAAALGTPSLNAIQNLNTAGGIADTGGVGTPVANVIQNLNTAGGIASPSAVGTPDLQYSNVLYVASIVAAGNAGTPTMSSTVTIAGAGGIASPSALGTPVANVIQNLNAAGGIASPSALGTPTTSTPATLSVTGIATSAALGTPIVNAPQTLSVSGIATTSALGSVALNTSISLTAVGIDASISSPVGIPTLSLVTTLTVTGIASPSAVSTPILAQVEETWGFLQLV